MDAILYGLAGILFVFFTITGWELERAGDITWSLGHTLVILSISLIMGIVVGESIRFLFLFLEKKWKKEQADTAHKWSGKLVWTGSFLGILLARFPFFLAFYPGICAYDISIQLGQIGEREYNLHHPLAHTLLLKAALDFGELLHSPSFGIACMVLGQVLLLAATQATGIFYLWKRGLCKGWLLFLQGVWMLYPFYGYLNVSVTKDVIFAIFFLLQMISLMALLTEESSGKWWQDLIFLASTVLMQLYRNNATYALLPFLGIVALCLLFWKGERKRFGRVFLEGVAGLLGGILCLAILTKATGALQGDKREMLSVPIQQMARCMIHHGGVGALPEDDDTMSEADKALVNAFLLYEGYLKYDEKLSDPVKENTNTYVVRYRTKEFLTTYLHFLKAYPGDMVNAFLTLNAGYFYLGDESHGRIYERRHTQGVSYAHTRWDPIVEEYGIYRTAAFQGLRTLLTDYAERNLHLRIPLLKYLFVPAIAFWAYVLVFLNGLRRKKGKVCVALALVMGYYATLFLGPAVQLRYLFPLLVALPFAMGAEKTERSESAA